MKRQQNVFLAGEDILIIDEGKITVVGADSRKEAKDLYEAFSNGTKELSSVDEEDIFVEVPLATLHTIEHHTPHSSQPQTDYSVALIDDTYETVWGLMLKSDEDIQQFVATVAFYLQKSPTIKTQYVNFLLEEFIRRIYFFNIVAALVVLGFVYQELIGRHITIMAAFILMFTVAII
ncbi:MAG: hypothetical protein MPJ24_07635, partial [Pirellulaceae bacterium]|nr:hypothetical protein [Pirellulaceae bacterium]